MATLQDFIDSASAGFVAVADQRNNDWASLMARATSAEIKAENALSNSARKDASNLSSAEAKAFKLKLNNPNNNFWNAEGNIPELVSGEGVEGEQYIVSVAGDTPLDGEAVWEPGDTVTFTEGVWVRAEAAEEGVATSLLYVTVEEFGAKANDPEFDNAPAINAAEAALKARAVEEPGFRGVLRWRGGVDYYFKDTLGMNRMGGVWQGNRTRLIYNGTSTTKDLVVFGHYGGGEGLAGKPVIRDVWVDGFQIMSKTRMTAGWAMRTRSCIESDFNVELQTQWGFETYGHNLWDGIWNEWSSTVNYIATTWVAQNRVSAISGAPGLAGGKSDAWIEVGKIAGGQVGCVVGGGYGGVFFGEGTTFIANKVHFREDQSLTAENNREIMLKSATLDYTDDISAAATGGSVGIDIVGPGECFIDINDCWIAGAHGAHIIVRSTSSAFINVSGNRFFFGKPHPSDGSLTGHGVVVDSNTARIHVHGGQVNSFPAVFIKPRITGHCVNYSNIMAWNCPLGLYDATFLPTTDTSYRIQSGFTVDRSGMFTSSMIVGEPGDVQFQMNRTDGVAKNPLIQFDANDFIKYRRDINVMEMKTGGTTNTLCLNAGGISILDQPYIAYAAFTGTVAVNGEGGQIHGIPSLASRAVMAQAYITETGGNITAKLVNIDNSYAGFTGATASRPYRMFIWYLKDTI